MKLPRLFGLVVGASVLAPGPVVADPAAEVALVTGLLSQLQLRSFAENVEYCGYIGFTEAGVLVATPPVRGDEQSCDPDEPDWIALVVASYHTHSAQTEDYFNEVPSPDDILSDAENGIDGYVSTPGGRLWYVDGETLTASQLCGAGCLPSDPGFEPELEGEIALSYTLEEIEILMEDDEAGDEDGN